MKRQHRLSLAAAAFALFGFSAMAVANDEHHPEGTKQEAAKETVKKDEMGMGMGMMGSGDMMKMMHDCMAQHKDGKMCEHQTMEKCQEKMNMADCRKMMKQNKAKEKTAKKK